MQAKDLHVTRTEDGLEAICNEGLTDAERAALLRNPSVARIVNGHEVRAVQNGFQVLGSPNHLSITDLQCAIMSHFVLPQTPE